MCRGGQCKRLRIARSGSQVSFGGVARYTPGSGERSLVPGSRQHRQRERPARQLSPPPGAQVIEDSTDYGHDSIVFGSVTPSAAASFYATALPRAGYRITSNSSATGDSWGSFSGTGIWFTGHGYNGQIGALSSFQIPGFSLGGNTGPARHWISRCAREVSPPPPARQPIPPGKELQ